MKAGGRIRQWTWKGGEKHAKRRWNRAERDGPADGQGYGYLHRPTSTWFRQSQEGPWPWPGYQTTVDGGTVCSILQMDALWRAGSWQSRPAAPVVGSTRLSNDEKTFLRKGGELDASRR
jgi:hypothetical protein